MWNLVDLKGFYQNIEISFIYPMITKKYASKNSVKRERWLILSTYRSPLLSIQYLLGKIFVLLDFYSSEKNSKALFGDFHLKHKNLTFMSFMESQNLVNLMKNHLCLEGEDSCLDFILANQKYS